LRDKWTPEVRDALKEDFEAAINLHGGPLLVLVKDNPKLKKFCGTFGFEHALNVKTNDGKEAEVLIRRKNNNDERLLRQQ
jgi:hypothetical protein